MTTLSEVVTLPISANGGLGLEARRKPIRKGVGPSAPALVHALEKRRLLLQTARVLNEGVDDLGVQRPPMQTGPRLEGLDRIRRQLADVHVGLSMSVTIAGVEFDHVVYDREADVLYLQVGSPPQAAADFDASPEGHYLRYDERGALMGVTIVNARAIFQREGKIPITLPEHRVEANDLEGVLAAA